MAFTFCWYCGQFHKIRYAAKRQLLLSPKPDSHILFVGNRILKKSNDPKASTFVQFHKTENPASGKAAAGAKRRTGSYGIGRWVRGKSEFRAECLAGNKIVLQKVTEGAAQLIKD